MRYLSLLLVICLSIQLSAQKASNWAPVEDHILTRWGKALTPETAWQEYPRPQMRRANWQNLNGLWDYTITRRNASAPSNYSGKILVPFALESALSGVADSLLPDQRLWYRRSLEVPSEWQNQRILLHFGAVDYETEVWVDNKKIGAHTGGFDPFTFDITAFVNPGKSSELRLAVWDPTDTGSQPRGKQQLKPGGIWYTPVSGIWQTVWLEATNTTAIETVDPVADIDAGTVALRTTLHNTKGGEKLKVIARLGGEVVHEKTYNWQSSITIPVPDARLWSPDQPTLYDLELTLLQNNQSIDRIESYFAMRKVHQAQDTAGMERIFLNNQPLFQYGTLDQGWWPDGLHTPPSAEGMRYDLEVLKSMGFNMLRKHIKVEPALYYYYADSIGIMLWQDMPSGFATNVEPKETVGTLDQEDWNRPEASAKQWETEWSRIIDHLDFFSSIVVWVPFNEGWGQFDSKRIAKWTEERDPTRLVNAISGWTDRNVGHFYDAHQYPGPGMALPQEVPGRISVLGEYGGLGLPIKDHLWAPNARNWGYITLDDRGKIALDYQELIYHLRPMIQQGLAAAIYTQTTDVEIEVNGLMTYDREIIKIDPAFLRRIHSDLYKQPSGGLEALVPDGENEARIAKITLLTGDAERGPSVLTKIPYDHPSGSTVISERSFKLSQRLSTLVLRIHANGPTKVFLNDKLVLNRDLRPWLHYDSYNLSEYTGHLLSGQNIIRVETENTRKEGRIFDFGLYGGN